MLNLFRQKGITSAVYGLIIAAIVVVFVVQFRPGAQGRSGSIRQECAAQVRGRCIEPKEYQAELMLVAPGRMVEPAQLRALGVRKAVLDGIVERTLLVLDAERLGLAVSEDELDTELAAGRARVSLPADRARMLGYALRLNEDFVRLLPVTNPDTKAFDYKIYDRVVRQFTGRSPTEFKVMQREELLASRMRDLVRSRVRLGDNEAFTTYEREKATATIRFATFRHGWFAQYAIDASPAAVEAWAKAHHDEVEKVFEGRKSRYLPECRSARHILVKFPEGATEAQKTEASHKIEAALERIKRGEDFAKVATQTSDDASAADGGDLGCFQRGRMVKPFEDAAFALTPGQISGIVQTQYGFHVIKLDGIYKDADAEALGRRETAKSLMMSHEAEALAAATAKKVLAAVKGGAKLDTAVAEALPSRRLVPAADPKAKKGANEPSQPQPQPQPSADDESNPDRPRVEISAPFNSSGDPIARVSPGQSVAQLAFKLAKDGDVPDDLIKLDDGYAVVQLKEKDPATKEMFEKERDAFTAAMLAAKQSDALNGYVGRLREAAKADVKLNEAYAQAPARDKESEGEGE